MHHPDPAARGACGGKLFAQPAQHGLRRGGAVLTADILIVRRPDHVVQDDDQAIGRGRMTHRIVAAGGIGLIEVGGHALGPDQAAHGIPGGREIGAAGIDAIVATAGIVVAQRQDRRLAAQRCRQRVEDEHRRLLGKFVDGWRFRFRVQKCCSLHVEQVHQQVARHEREVRAGHGFAELRHGRRQQRIVAVLAGRRRRSLLGGGEDRRPLRRRGARQGRGQVGIGEGTEMDVAQHHEGAGQRSGLTGRRIRQGHRERTGRGQDGCAQKCRQA